ncbi:hypothetical protein L484_017292 [Morus notabilis]|uniref:Uncharacterized protein n=1 Tax=Morus notabilis TaxID=981085 RepID=W9RSX8_9ROSA|nr:uncharacterized protein LOC21400295 [Morus notabilis]EXC06826.1 hypothetical protein L484_017292 [Morus notabilis]
MESSEPLEVPETPTDVEPEDLEKLESEVKELAEKILHYRAALPEKLKNTFVSVLAAQRPYLPDLSEPGTSGEVSNPDAGNVTSNVPANGAQGTLEKIQLLKDKISSNASAMPVVVKRMQECLLKIDKLDSQNLTIHPAFKRKRTS